MSCTGAIAGLVTGLVLANAEPVVIGTDAPFPAYTYLDATGRITGYERDLMDQVCTRAAFRCTWELATFDQLIPGVMSGRFDVVLGGMAVTDERRRLVDFTDPYHTTDPEEWYIGRPGAPEPALAMTVVQSGTVHEAHLRDFGYPHRSYSTEAEVLNALVDGKADLALGPFQSRPDVQAVMDANGIDFLYSEMLPDDGVAMAVCQGNRALLDSLNAALASIKADGTLQALETRWFD
jgi:polar amino acid transport system substrate-binding protein